MGKLFIGFDNGSNGTIGFIGENGHYDMARMPNKVVQDYQKTATEVCRVDHMKLEILLDEKISDVKPDNPGAVKVLIERPFTMKFAFKSMMSGRRALEAVLITLERHHIGYAFIDSKEWQKAILPKPTLLTKRRGAKLVKVPAGNAEMKKFSLQVGQRLFPCVEGEEWTDYDGLLIAEYLRRQETGIVKQ